MDLYFIQQTQQPQGEEEAVLDVVVAGRLEEWLPHGGALVWYKVGDAFAESMNVIPPYELPNVKFYRNLQAWERDWAACMADGEALKPVGVE